MLKRRLGGSDIHASLIGYGCWKAGKSGWPGAEDEKTLEAIAAALDHGVNFFDTAPAYGLGHAEKILGQALRGKRDRVHIATKVGLVWDDQGNIERNLAPDSVKREIDASLRRLNTDYVDLIQVHWNDHRTPIEEVMAAFIEAREQGKVRWFGVCNLDLDTVERARRAAEIVSVQVLYSLMDRNSHRYLLETLEYETENEIVPYCREHTLGLIPYSPLGQGFLSDDFDVEGLPEDDVRRLNKAFADNIEKRARWLETAHAHGMSLSELAIAWLARQEVVTSIIVASTNPHHIAENVRALERIKEIPELP